MSDKIKKIKVKKADGSMTDYIPIGADAENIDTTDGESVQLKLNKKPYYYNTVADMKADNKLKVGDMAITLGYYEANDGGRAEYKIVNSSNKYYEELNNNLKAELIIDNQINVKQLGAYGDNSHDDLVPLQNAINNFKVVYIPYGNYHISDGLVVDKDVIIKGDSKLSFPSLGSFINMTKENSVLLNCTDNAVHVELNSIGITSTSSHVNVDSNFQIRPNEPYNPYHYTETVENCCGILATKKLKINNCYFTGFSGYAINANANALITDVWVSHSNIGIRINGYDPIITRPYITLCNIGIDFVQNLSSSVFLYDIWIDQIVTYGIHSYSLIGIINGEMDHIGYSGIYAEGNAKVNLDMRIGRCGMYYAGTSPENINNNDLIYSCLTYLTNILDSQIKITYEYRDIGANTGTTNYMLPKCVLGVKQFIRSFLQTIENDNVELIRVINYANSNGTLLTQNGIKKWDSTTRQFKDIYTPNV